MAEELSPKQKRVFFKRKRLRRAYKDVFSSEQGQLVLLDLQKMCVFANTDLVQPDLMLHAQGRIWVYKRIHKFLNMNDEELLRLTKETE
jgi:hypothetical protein